jgi:hypothetical protein
MIFYELLRQMRCSHTLTSYKLFILGLCVLLAALLYDMYAQRDQTGGITLLFVRKSKFSCVLHCGKLHGRGCRDETKGGGVT